FGELVEQIEKTTFPWHQSSEHLALLSYCTLFIAHAFYPFPPAHTRVAGGGVYSRSFQKSRRHAADSSADSLAAQMARSRPRLVLRRRLGLGFRRHQNRIAARAAVHVSHAAVRFRHSLPHTDCARRQSALAFIAKRAAACRDG